jgi:hypothetical protein
MKRYCLLLGCFAVICLGEAPTELCDLYVDQVARIQATRQTPDAHESAISAILKPAQHAACIATELAKGVQRQLLKDMEASRTDKQAGASGGTGTTNLVSKGVAAKALSIASEYGALTESVSGQTVTVSGSLEGVPAGVIRGGLALYCLDGIPRSLQKGCVSQNALNILRKLTYSVSFDTSRSSQSITAGPAQTTTASVAGASSTAGGVTPVTFTPNGHQISSISGRFEIWNQRDVTSAAYVDNWLKAIKDASGGQAASAAAKKLLADFQVLFDMSMNSSPAYQAWFTKAIETLRTSSDVKTDWSTLYAQLLEILRSSKGVTQAAADFVRALDRYQLAQDDLIAATADKPVFTFEYVDNRPVGQDSDSTFRLIFDKGFGKNWSLTANTAMSVWDHGQSTPFTHLGRLRDVQAAAELDYKLGKLGGLISGAATLAGSYYFQSQHSPILLNVDASQPLPGITFVDLPSGATKVLADTGNIHIGQLKLVLGPGSSSVRVPIAFSYSNRTELVPKPNWRAQIGVSYDFDSLFTK